MPKQRLTRPNLYKDNDIYNDDKNGGKVLAIVLIILLIIAGGIGAFVFFTTKSSDSKSNSTATATTTVSTVSNSATTTVTNKTSTNSNTGTVTPTVTTTTVTTTPSITETPSLSPKSGSNSEFDIRFTYPGDWSSATVATTKDCTISKSFLRGTCSGTFDSQTLFITSSDNYNLTIEGAISDTPTPTCDRTSNFFVYVKGTKYEFPVCTGSTYMGTLNMTIPGAKSKWTTMTVKFTAKDRAMMEKVLDILASIS